MGARRGGQESRVVAGGLYERRHESGGPLSMAPAR
jgi:hypothetical protein